MSKITFIVVPDLATYNSPIKKNRFTPEFDKINNAIRYMKTCSRPHKLGFIEKDGTARTLMYFQGRFQFQEYSRRKIKGLVKVGERMWMPGIFVNRTNRKLKKKCGP